jgi:hypothetical protein
MIAESLNNTSFSIANRNNPMTKSGTSEYISLEERRAAPRQTHARVEVFHQTMRQFSLKVFEHLQISSAFLNHPSEEKLHDLHAHQLEMETLWEEMELQQRVLLNDNSLERFHHEQFDRYSKAATHLFLISRTSLHLERFVHLASPSSTFLARTPLDEAIQQVLQVMLPLVESLLRGSTEGAENALTLLGTIAEKPCLTADILVWKQHLPSYDYRLLRASLYALFTSQDSLHEIAQEYKTRLIPTLGGKAMVQDLLNPLSKV